MKTKEKEMKVSQSYRAALIAAHTIDQRPQKPKSALRGLMQPSRWRFSRVPSSSWQLALRAARAQDEAAVRAPEIPLLRLSLRGIQLRASLFVENGTFVTPVGDYLKGGSPW